MADLITDGFTRVFWLTTGANLAALTTTELNAGLLLHDTMTADGLIGFQPDTAAIATSKFSARFNTEKPGRVNFGAKALRFAKQDGTDTIFNTLAYNTVGIVVVRRSLLATTAWASTQKYEAYAATCGERRKLDPAENTLERWEIPLFFHAAPELNGAVA